MESGSHFKDSVVHAQFNHDGTYLAVADFSGVIKVWKLNGDLSANKEIVWEFETSDISVNSADGRMASLVYLIIQHRFDFWVLPPL